MTKQTSRIILFVVLAAVASGLSGCCSTHKDHCEVFIISQPEDDSVAIGASSLFSAFAVQGPPFSTNGLMYQWQENHTPDIASTSTNWIDRFGATNACLAVVGAQIADVGFYRVKVKGCKTKVTAPAGLAVYSATTNGGGAFFTVFGPPAAGGGNIPGCPGSYAGKISYWKKAANGWGWAPIVGMGPYIAADGTTRTDTKVEMTGSCAPGPCSVTPNVQASLPCPLYRFTIYFPNNVPATNGYPLALTGFAQ